MTVLPEILYVYNCTNSNSYLNLIKTNKHKREGIIKLKRMHLAIEKYLREELVLYLPLLTSDLVK